MKLFFCVFFLLGCATSKENYSLESELQSIQNVQKINYGPTKLISTSFIDKTKEYGLEGLTADNFNIVDLNDDGYSDLVILERYLSFPSFFLFNKNNKKFEKISYDPLPKDTRASHLYFYDFDNDKILDVLVGVLNQKTELKESPVRLFKGYYKDNKLFFKKTNLNIGNKENYNASISLIDYDLDGDLDVFLGNWFTVTKKNTLAQKDQLLENIDNKLVDITEKLIGENAKSSEGVYLNAKPTYASSICDIDQNGYPDILTASTNSFANKLWLNRYNDIQGLRYFKDFGIISKYGADSDGNLTAMGAGRTFTTNCADYNNDGIMDVFLGELYHNYDSSINDKSSILTGSSLNFPPKFIRTEYFLDNEDIEWHQADRRAIWFDYNNDGLKDLLIDNSGYPPHSRLILFMQLSDHSFVNIAKEEGIDIVNPQSSVIADFNQDGKMDILTSQSDLRDTRIKRRVYLFENHVDTTDRQSLKIYLRGQKSNTHALGAMVILKINSQGKKVYKRQYVEFSQGGLAPQNEEVVHFGIKSDESIEFIKVRWPFNKNKNTNLSKLEKIYKIKNIYKQNRSITLCEDGIYFEGKRNCD